MPVLALPFLRRMDFRRALGFVWHAARGWTLVTLLLLLLASVLPLAVVYVYKLIIDLLVEASSGALPRQELVSAVSGLLAGAFCLAVAGSLFNALITHAKSVQAYLVADYMQRLVQKKSIELDLEFYEDAKTFDGLHRAQREAPSRPLQIVEALTNLARNGFTLVAALVVLMSFNGILVLCLLAAGSPILFYRLKNADELYKLEMEATAKQRLCGYLNRILTLPDHAKEVRTFGFGPHLIRRFSEARAQLRGSLRQLSARAARRQFYVESGGALAVFGSLALVVTAGMKRDLSVGEVVMYLGAFYVALGSLRPTLSAASAVYENNLFLNTLHEFLAVQRRVCDPEIPREMPRPWRSGLRLQGVSFTYPETTAPVLVEVDLECRPGEVVALVGRNGSGKTTLTKLLCRLYDPSGGSITIDGHDLREFSAEDVRREMGAISQDFGRYHLSARENIFLGRPDRVIDEPAIREAALLSGIHEKLSDLPAGYDTILNRSFAGGTELSIGQWQMLALARAYYRRAQFIILDEPTSALDAVAEHEFFERFREATRGHSALIISHRFSSVRLADRIYVLDKGKIVEHGTHDELVALAGLYAHLYGRQASYYREGASETAGARAFDARVCASG